MGGQFRFGLVRGKTTEQLSGVRYWIDCGDDDFYPKGIACCTLHLLKKKCHMSSGYAMAPTTGPIGAPASPMPWNLSVIVSDRNRYTDVRMCNSRYADDNYNSLWIKCHVLIPDTKYLIPTTWYLWIPLKTDTLLLFSFGCHCLCSACG